MGFIRKTLDLFTQGSDRPLLRLFAYYLLLGLVVGVMLHFVPGVDDMFSGERLEELSDAPVMLQDGLSSTATFLRQNPRIGLAIGTALGCLGTLALMLPVTWVYMVARKTPGHNQAVVQTLIILPIVVAGIVLIVRNSLALAFSLTGVVAAVRFRTTLRDTRDVVFVFLAIGVGFAAGVQMFTVAILVSIIFNFVLLFTWRYDFGHNVLEPTAASRWAAPLNAMADDKNGQVPDRDLVLALSQKKAGVLADRLKRVRNILGTNGKKPRYNAVLTLTTDNIGEAQRLVEDVLDEWTRRWKLDEVVDNDAKPSVIYYLVRLRRSVDRKQFITALHSEAGNTIQNVNLEVGDELAAEEEARAKELEKAESA
jgi:hypothetical protein